MSLKISVDGLVGANLFAYDSLKHHNILHQPRLWG